MNRNIVSSRLPKLFSIALLGAGLLASGSVAAQEAKAQASANQYYPHDGLHPSPTDQARSWR